MLLARCYANFYWFFKSVFGVDVPVLSFVQTFGFFVAMGFLVAATFLYSELKRREKLGWLKPYQTEILVGEPVKPIELILNFVLGFVLGYKIVGLLFNSQEALANPQAWMVSSKGSIIGGIAVGAFLALQKWYEKNTQKLDAPRKEIMTLWPHDMIGDIVLWAAIGGISGAKIFYLFETPGNFTEFLHDPFGSFFGGLTIFGGVLGGAVTVLGYAYYRKINLLQMADAASPTLLIALAVGRIGCQMAGDGDWGINNPAPNPHSWLPNWLWSYSYPNNVNHEGVCMFPNLPDCHCADFPYCFQTAVPVFPTPLYEIILCTALFALLWSIRKHIVAPGAIFALYFLVSGIERITIEQIRVNTKLDVFGIKATQAEIIAVAFMVIGVVGYITATTLYKKKLKDEAARPHHIITEE